MDSLTILAQQLRTQNRDRFVHALFVPPQPRQNLVVLYALEAELDHVHSVVREEMIGHIRLAWWEENLAGLYESKVRQGHPLLEALAPLAGSGQLSKEQLLAIIGAYREAFPERPQQGRELVDAAAACLLSPDEQVRWRKAGAIIAAHRAKHPHGGRAWLALKLLLMV